jgi:putative beta-lysine N-acetyltransferase
MRDTVTCVGQTLIQHGSHNDRIYVMKLSALDMPHIVHRLYDMAMENSYSKIFVKVPAFAMDTFIKAGYVVEAYVPGLFHGQVGGYFMARYIDGTRAIEKSKGAIDSVLSAARLLSGKRRASSLKEGLTFHMAGHEDAGELASLYKKTFATYPFPIHDVGYLLKAMENNVRFFCVRANGAIVGASSAEMDVGSMNVEMTDFATSEEFQGNGISAYLLHKMEENMAREGMKVAYTIARATSYPINKIFSRAGYLFGGRLTNNTNICGAYESMNVWYKPLD